MSGRSILRFIGGALLLPFILAWTGIYLACSAAWGAVLRVWFWRAYASRGRFIMFVYSDSPVWKAYLENQVLPQIREKAVVLDWSERSKWPVEHPWEARFFRKFAGDREFNPIALVFGPYGRVTAIRFYRAFRDHKHGRSEALERATSRLLETLVGAAPP